MQINLVPVRLDARPTVEVDGDALIVDGEIYDFSPLPEGAELPAEAIDSDWFCGPVRRVGDVLTVTLRLAHGADAPEETRFPAPITVTEDGSVTLPPFSAEVSDDEN